MATRGKTLGSPSVLSVSEKLAGTTLGLALLDFILSLIRSVRGALPHSVRSQYSAGYKTVQPTVWIATGYGSSNLSRFC